MTIKKVKHINFLKYLPIVATIIFACHLHVYGQHTNQEIQTQKLLMSDKPFYPNFFINYSFIQAVGKYAQGHSFSTGVPDQYLSEFPSGTLTYSTPAMGPGFAFEIGNIFWFRHFKKAPKLRMGFIAAYSNFHVIYKEGSNNISVADVIQLTRGAAVLAYNPFGALLINMHAGIAPSIDVTSDEPILNIRGEVGVNISYKRLYFGIAYNFGQLEENYNYYDFTSHNIAASFIKLKCGFNFLPSK